MNSSRNFNISHTLKEFWIRSATIDQSDILGYFYDARTNSLLHKLSLGLTPIVKREPLKPVQCDVYGGDTCDHKKLLEIVGIDDDLWLSAILKIVPDKGILSSVNYSFPRNEHIRLLYYYYLNEEQSISYQQNVVKQIISKKIPDINATHIISAIRSGIEMLTVLEIPGHNQDYFNHLLKEISEQLKRNRFELRKEQQQRALHQIKIRKVFSNIPDLLKRNTLEEICNFLTIKKPHAYCHNPLEYSLREVHWFYPDYPLEKAKNIVLQPSFHEIIKQYLFQLPSQSTDGKMYLQQQSRSIDVEDFEMQFDELQEKIKIIRENNPSEIERIRELVIDIRSGKITEDNATKMLMSRFDKSLSNKVDMNKNAVHSSLKNESQLNNFEQTHKRGSNLSRQQSESTQAMIDTSNFQKPTMEIDAHRVKKQQIYEHEKTNSSQSSTICISKPGMAANAQIQEAKNTSSHSALRESTFTIDIYRQKVQSDDMSELTKQQESRTRSAPGDSSRSSEMRFQKSQEILNSPVSSKRLKFEKKPPELQQSNNPDKPNNVSDLFTPTTSQSAQQEREILINTAVSMNTPKSLNSSTTEDRRSQEKTTSNQTEVHPSDLQNSSQITEQTRGVVKPLDSSQSLETLPVQDTFRLHCHSNIAKEQCRPSASIPIFNSRSVKSTEEQFGSTTALFDTSTSSRSSLHDNHSSIKKHHTPFQSPSNSSRVEIQTAFSPSLSNEKDHRNLSTSSIPDVVNVLLLGESGVGKSTFINAFVNYLSFETLQEARSHQPVVLMPVSFLITVGDDFQERIVTFGDPDSNEDHHHPGQSVTQHCRSYVFQINSHTKLRIIDTPGMGDTRGLDQDDLNMKHILSFINTLPHLNAMCVLLKPNESRLNIVLRSYFTRLLNFLGENARHNLVFCFTNTRSTFYTPGNTAPLLRKMIDNLPMKEISFQKSNTFCFDSESFRYLIILRNGIELSSDEEEEYEKSWTTSSNESKRLFRYICDKLKCYPYDEWKSVEHAQFQISELIRPMLETMRNYFRNLVLLEDKSTEELIKLVPIVLLQSSAICHGCVRRPKRFGEFWILPDDVHVIDGKCRNCDCSRRKHIEIDYKLEYELIQNVDADCSTTIKSKLDRLRTDFLHFSEISGEIFGISKESDPMLSALSRMIAEERQVCLEKDWQRLNMNVHDQLVELKQEYEESWKRSPSNDSSINLSNIYELIKSINEINEIKEQINMIRESQAKYMQETEKQIN